MKYTQWKLIYNSFNPKEEKLREVLCALGNGFFCTRSAAPEAKASYMHYPATYVAGLYNRLTTKIAGKKVVNEDLVNCPNWTWVSFSIDGGDWVVPSTTKIISYSQILMLKQGIWIREMRIKDKQGRITKVIVQRWVHMKWAHYAGQRYTIIPENYSANVTVRSLLDASIENQGVERYRQLNSKHWLLKASGQIGKNGIYILTQTNQSKILLAQAAQHQWLIGNKKAELISRLLRKEEIIGRDWTFFMEQGHRYTLEKIVSIYTSHEPQMAGKNVLKEAIRSLKNIPSWQKFLSSHIKEWDKLWSWCYVNIEHDLFSLFALRLHIFHLLQTGSLNSIGLDSGFPARGWHGEAYRGHIFWDELFILPFFERRIPQLARAILNYRYRRLPAARNYARSYHYKGAMFPWQSASSGTEETQVLHLNPLSGQWGPDYSRLQRHVSFAIAYNVWHHYIRTGDWNYIEQYGAELFLSIAQFAASLVYFDRKDGRYHTKGIMGPDEFHEKVSSKAKQPGLKDNAYSNFMIAWTLRTADILINKLSEKVKQKLLRKLKINESDLIQWKKISRRMAIVINQEGIISQFDGYFKLKELNWEVYRRHYKNIHRMDRILKAEGKSPDDYKVSKQADVLMIFYLFPFEEIKDIFHSLGYHFSLNMARKNYHYYLSRTSHGSTLSKVVHCLVALKLNKPKEAWRWFEEVLSSDIYDTQGGTTPEGIHTGVMAGSVDIVTRGFCGIRFFEDHIKISPCFPKQWKRVTLALNFQENRLLFVISAKYITVQLLKKNKKTRHLYCDIKGKKYNLIPSRKIHVHIS